MFLFNFLLLKSSLLHIYLVFMESMISLTFLLGARIYFSLWTKNMLWTAFRKFVPILSAAVPWCDFSILWKKSSKLKCPPPPVAGMSEEEARRVLPKIRIPHFLSLKLVSWVSSAFPAVKGHCELYKTYLPWWLSFSLPLLCSLPFRVSCSKMQSVSTDCSISSRGTHIYKHFR